MPPGDPPVTCGGLVLSTPCERQCVYYNPSEPCQICIGDTPGYKVGVTVEAPGGVVCNLPIFVDWDDGQCWGMSASWPIPLPLSPAWITGKCSISLVTDVPGFYCGEPEPTWRYFGVVEIEPNPVNGPQVVEVEVEEVPPP